MPLGEEAGVEQLREQVAKLEEELRERKAARETARKKAAEASAEAAAGANSPGTHHHHRWEGARMRNAAKFDFTSGACDPAITQPWAKAAADAARWAGCRGGDGVLVGGWRFESRDELEWQKQEALANNPGSAIHALYDCCTSLTHLVLLRSDRVAVQNEVANLCRRLWISSVEVDGPEYFEKSSREYYVWTRERLCPVELEIHLRRMQTESSIRNAAAAAELRKGKQQHVHDAIETAGQIVVCEESSSPLVDETDVVPSTVFALGDVHLLEEDGGATSVDSSSRNSSSSSSSSRHADVGSDDSFGNGGDIDQYGSSILPEVLLSLDFADFGEVHLLEEQDTDAVSGDSSYSSGSSDTGEEAANDDGYLTGHNGGKRLPRARKEGTVRAPNRPFDRGKFSGFGG